MSTSTHSRWMIVLVLLLVSAMAQMTSAAGEVTWYWKDVNVSGFTPSSGHQSNKFMNTSEAPGGDANYTVTLEKGERAWWYTNYPAECDVSFPKGNWTTTFWVDATNSTDNKKNIYIKLYNVSSTGGKNKIWEKRPSISNPTNVEKVEVTNDNFRPFKVLKDEHIAVEVYWVNTANGSLIIYYNSTTYNSTLTSPPDSPVWPVPEPATIILFSAGLLILAGYIVSRKMNNRP